MGTKVTLDAETAARLGIKKTVDVRGGRGAFGRGGTGAAYVTYTLLDGRRVTTHDEPGDPSSQESLDRGVSLDRVGYAVAQVEFWQDDCNGESLQQQALNRARRAA